MFIVNNYNDVISIRSFEEVVGLQVHVLDEKRPKMNVGLVNYRMVTRNYERFGLKKTTMICKFLRLQLWQTFCCMLRKLSENMWLFIDSSFIVKSTNRPDQSR